MLKNYCKLTYRSLLQLPGMRISRKDEEMSVSYSEVIERLTNVEIPKNYLNTKFSDIMQHIQPQVPNTPASITKSITIRSQDFSITQDGYASYFSKYPAGSFESFKHKDKQIKTMGFNYTNMGLGTLWKMMLLSQPDVILIAAKPDLMLKEFRLNVKNPKTQAFSNRLYYQQLEVDPMDVICNQDTENEVAKYIDTFFLSNVPARIKNAENSKTHSIYNNIDKMTAQVLSLAVLFAKRKSVPLVLADLPDILYREHFTNPLTVAQFKQMFVESSIESALNPDTQPSTPLNLNLARMPEFGLQLSDSYIGSLVEYMIRKTSYKRYLIIGGNGQSFGVKSIIQNRAPVQLDELLTPPEPRANLYNTVPIEEFIEKQSIYDVFSQGQSLLKKNPTLFKNSHALIEKYSDLEASHPKLSYFKQMHSDFVQHYFKLYAKQFKIGIEKKENYFIEKAIELKKR